MDEFRWNKFYYNYDSLPFQFGSKSCKKAYDCLNKRYNKLATSWDKEKNSEWICRIYMSAKMIFSATLMLNSLWYSEEKNIRIVIPYLRYYSLLCSLRAIVFTIPELHWNDSKLIELSHTKIANHTIDYITIFCPNYAKKLKDIIDTEKSYREVFSYRFPSEGDEHVNGIDSNLESTLKLLCELAQFNSEIIENQVKKCAQKDSFVFLNKYIDNLCFIELNNISFFDNEEAYRLGYMKRKCSFPTNICLSMREGQVDDFFGIWGADEERDQFDPDSNIRCIFNIP